MNEPSLFRENLAANAGVLQRMAMDQGQELSVLVGFAKDMLAFLTQQPEEEPLPVADNLGDLLMDSFNGKAFMSEDDAMHMVRFGLPKIDSHLVSNPGSLGVIAGKTSTGKTTFAVQALIKTALAGHRSLIFSLEMTKEEIGARWVANYRDVDSYEVMRGKVGEPQAVKDREAHYVDALNLATETLVVSDGTCTSFDSICKVIRREVQVHGVKVVFVDYFTLVNPPDTHTRNANVAYILGQMSKGFKALAKELMISIVLISQFNREVDDGEEPYLKHLRETGQLEQDANWVVLLWTEQKSYEMDQNRVVNVKVEKNRSGKRNVRCSADFTPATGRFIEKEMATGSEKPVKAPAVGDDRYKVLLGEDREWGSA